MTVFYSCKNSDDEVDTKTTKYQLKKMFQVSLNSSACGKFFLQLIRQRAPEGYEGSENCPEKILNSEQNSFFGDDMFNECPTEQLDGREFSDQDQFIN